VELLLLNRTPSTARIHAGSKPGGLEIGGCGLRRYVIGPKTGIYQIAISIIVPHIDLAGDGKEPVLAPFSEAIATVLRKSCNAAHRAMDKPPGGMTFKEAAWLMMPAAYLSASTQGTLPANARQVMYPARPGILELTGKEKLNAVYFTQILLPDYIEEHPEITRDWDVVFDDRGTFIEPHTGRVVPLGTIEVRQYLGERLMPEIPATLDSGSLAPTTGPTNRYLTVLFIEKEGFSALLAHALIAERFDIAIMSTKGMSNVAARMLIDRLAPYIDQVLVLHDFDVSGFGIYGTLGSDSRRYKFDNEVHIVDLGLRLADVEEMDLQSEPVETDGDWEKHAATLAGHGATDAEIRFLQRSRVELNAMSSGVFVSFLERKLIEHGVHKVVPTDDVLEQHARRVIESRM
jgi:Topoisomerase 6 subunit A/Spo11, Toprim domain